MSKLFIPCEGYELSVLQSNFFKLTFDKIAHVEFFCQTVALPDMTFGTAWQTTRIHDLKWVGEKLVMGALNATILVDEKLIVYEELYEWMFNISVNGLAQDTVSDCILQIQDRRWHFKDVYPVDLSGFNVSSALSVSTPVTLQVQFAYNNFTFD